MKHAGRPARHKRRFLTSTEWDAIAADFLASGRSWTTSDGPANLKLVPAMMNAARCVGLRCSAELSCLAGRPLDPQRKAALVARLRVVVATPCVLACGGTS